ncbi:hypothetical protein GH714_003037 [Hevea brasiliensis]|uniref:Serine-threonine/tyrosine-protein kinase catalytic domain-containing protein n=1 Tax=Hevea brasiliensis TaxID=3981 RepID=A0A6A6MWN8_HEVBR|nr:hypothetical protein GH714_003037 [Hevea brasiliensis]
MEFMPNGNLEALLHSNSYCLDMLQRVWITGNSVYGIMLMETFTRKKPTGEMCLKDWVLDSLQSGEMMDSNTNESDLAANVYNLS